MAELRKQEGIAALAAEFLILTCVRTSDILRAQKKDINRAERQWNIPAFSKTGKPHRVPLSDAALAVLDKVEKIGGESEHRCSDELNRRQTSG